MVTHVAVTGLYASTANTHLRGGQIASRGLRRTSAAVAIVAREDVPSSSAAVPSMNSHAVLDWDLCGVESPVTYSWVEVIIHLANDTIGTALALKIAHRAHLGATFQTGGQLVLAFQSPLGAIVVISHTNAILAACRCHLHGRRSWTRGGELAKITLGLPR
jgi:hypothetical protein